MHQVCPGTCRMSNPEELYQQAQLKREEALALTKEMGDLENRGSIELAEAKFQEVRTLQNEARKLMDEYFRQLRHQIMSTPGKQPMHVQALMHIGLN